MHTHTHTQTQSTISDPPRIQSHYITLPNPFSDLYLFYTIHWSFYTHYTHTDNHSPCQTPPTSSPGHPSTTEPLIPRWVNGSLFPWPQTFQSHHTAVPVGPLILSGHTNPPYTLLILPPVHSFLLWAATQQWAPLDPTRRQGVVVGEYTTPELSSSHTSHYTGRQQWSSIFLTQHRVRLRVIFVFFLFYEVVFSYMPGLDKDSVIKCRPTTYTYKYINYINSIFFFKDISLFTDQVELIGSKFTLS